GGCRGVINPCLVRPPCRFLGMLSERGIFAPGVKSAKSLTVAPRRPGEVGLYRRIPMGIDQSFRRNQFCVPNPTSQSLFSNPACDHSGSVRGAACLCDSEYERE